MVPRVSIVVLNYNHPGVIGRLLDSLSMTTGVPYELVVVDNGSTPDVVELLKCFKASGKIDTLVLEPINHFFSEGNNIGVRHSNPGTEYILLLNSDTRILHPEWLLRLARWMEGTQETQPSDSRPVVPTPGPKDVVSIGWSSDPLVPGHARAEGWCCLIRRSKWKDLSPDFPFHGGFEEMVADRARSGAKVGVLVGYDKYIVHDEQGSGGSRDVPAAKRPMDIETWFRGTPPTEMLNFARDAETRRCYGYLEW